MGAEVAPVNAASLMTLSLSAFTAYVLLRMIKTLYLNVERSYVLFAIFTLFKRVSSRKRRIKTDFFSFMVNLTLIY